MALQFKAVDERIQGGSLSEQLQGGNCFGCVIGVRVNRWI